MPKYQYVFFYSGRHAAAIAERKKIALGGDARVLTLQEADKEGIESSGELPPLQADITHVVFAGKQKEEPRHLTVEEAKKSDGNTPA